MRCTGYPTLKWFPPGTVQGEGYTGGRASQDMIRFVNSRSGVQARPKHRPAKVSDLADMLGCW